MNTETKYLLYFIGGIIWAAATSRKAYAPNYNQSDMLSNLDPNRECPPGTEKMPISCCEALSPQCISCQERERRLGGFECVKKLGPPQYVQDSIIQQTDYINPFKSA